MLDFTNIDAIQFLQDKVNNIRVYYQNTDKTIRESCFDDKRKWYTTGDFITRDAREKSPIAVTRWNGGTEIRVYFLNDSDRICEMVGKSEVGQPTKWEQGGDLSAASVASVSQIGIARPGRDDSSLRVYYQDATTDKIREIMYWYEEEGWSVSPLEISEAMVGTRLSVVSAKPPGNIRLYYQGRDGNLKEHFFKQEDLEWSPSRLPSIHLIAKAPICAICWYADNKESIPRDLRIRVFTIPQSSSKSVAQIVFNLNQGWNSKPMTLAEEVLTSPPSYVSAIAACQTTDVAKGAISVFYQPESQIIDLKPVGVSHGNAGLAEVKDVVIPRGIPVLFDIAGSLPAVPPQAEPDTHGRTQLHHAAMNGDLMAAQTIIDSKAIGFDVNDNDKRCPLYYAITNKHTSVAIVLAHKWKISDAYVTTFINDNTDVHKASALFEAVEGNDSTTVGFLIEIGANVNAQGYGRWPEWRGTPLHSAAYLSPNDGIIKMLLGAGANKYITDARGHRAYTRIWGGNYWPTLA